MRTYRFAAAALLTLLVSPPLLAAQAPAASASDETHFSRTIQVGRGSSLSLSNLAGGITVRAGRGGEIRIDATKNGGEPDRVEIDVAEHAGRVEVHTVHRYGNDRASVTFDVTVPADASVDLRSISGNIEVSGVQGGVRAESVSGSVTADAVAHVDRLKSVSGNVRITGASADGDITTGSISGSVTIRNLKADGLDLSTVSGDMTLDGITCNRATIRTVSGNVDYAGPLARNGRYEVTSHSGDITLRLAGRTGFEFDGTSFSGDIHSDFPITIQDTGDSGRRFGPQRHAVHGTFGDASALVTVRTFSGDISVKRQ